MSSGRRRFLLILGCGIVAVGGTLFVLIAGALPGNFHSGSSSVFGVNIFVAAVFLALTIWGGVTVRGRNRHTILMLNLVLLLLAAVMPILGETAIRLGIASGSSWFRAPSLYADALSEVDYHKLRALWQPQQDSGEEDPGVSKVQYDARLGWSYARTAENPLGILATIPYDPQDERRPVLFFGDSFVVYGGRVEDKIPQMMDRRFSQFRTYNYGVGGFGLDQIYLRFQESVDLFQDPIVLFGLLTTDIDRCLLTFRGRPKPSFRIEGGELVLQGVPVTRDSDRYLDEHPVAIRSFFAAAVTRAYARLKDGGRSDQSQVRRAEKEALASKILEAVKREAGEKQLDLVFVVFTGSQPIDWRRDFLISELRRLQLDFIDVQEILLAAESEAGRKHHQSFDHTGHHSTWANAQIAKDVSDYVLEHYGSGTAPSGVP